MPPQKRKAGRAAPAVASTADHDASQSSSKPTQGSRKRARTSTEPNTKTRSTRTAGTTGATKTKGRPAKAAPGRRRSSLQEVQPEEAQNQATEKRAAGKKSRRPKSGSQGQGDASGESATRPGPARRARASLDNTKKRAARRPSVTTAASEPQPSPAQERPTRRRRQSSVATVDTEEVPPSPPKPYPHIARRTRRIRRSHISAKWSPLTAPSLAAAHTILTLAHRPILQRLSQTSQRRQHTAAALRLITNRINRRLSRGIPFPPAAAAAGSTAAAAGAGREVELNFEGVLDGRAVLERQLDPAMHAVELLKKEKARVEAELERDYETLRNLEAGARGQARQQRDLLKKSHGLAPQGFKREEQSGPVFKREETESKGALFTDLQDEDVKAVALQLSGHAESMRANLQQVEGIGAEMEKSRAALRAVLVGHLDAEQYDRVVLG